jgi:hypothetical protein
MNKLVERIRRSEAFSILSACDILMNDHRDLSGGYDRLKNEEVQIILDVLQCRVKNWKYKDNTEKGYDLSVLLIIIEVLQIYNIDVFGNIIGDDHPIWKYGCKMEVHNV